HLGQPDAALHVDLHELVEGVFLQVEHRTDPGVNGGVRHHDVHSTPSIHCPIDQVLQLLLATDIAWNGNGFTTRSTNLRGCGLARICLAARNHHLGAVLCHALGACQPEPSARTGDDCDLAAQIKEGRDCHLGVLACLFAMRINDLLCVCRLYSHHAL